MILALKELSVRGDVRTPVEVLIYILGTNEFRHSLVHIISYERKVTCSSSLYADCKIHTGWLDDLIASEFKPEKPDLWLLLVCGVVFKAHSKFLVYLHSIRYERLYS